MLPGPRITIALAILWSYCEAFVPYVAISLLVPQRPSRCFTHGSSGSWKNASLSLRTLIECVIPGTDPSSSTLATRSRSCAVTSVDFSPRTTFQWAADTREVSNAWERGGCGTSVGIDAAHGFDGDALPADPACALPRRSMLTLAVCGTMLMPEPPDNNVGVIVGGPRSETRDWSSVLC